MAEPDLILAVDQGTSSSKALLVDHRGAIVSRGSGALGQQTPRPGWVEQSAADIWASIQTAVAGALAGQDPSRIRAVGLSTQRESLLLWDRATGEPVGPLVSWQDQRTAGACRALLATGADDMVRRVSGLPIDPMFSAAKAQWLLDTHDPDRRRSTRGELCLGTVDSWLLFRLGAGHVIEVGNAARTQLMNVRSRTWDPQLLELFGVPAECLPVIAASTGPFTTAGALAGVPAHVPVAAVMGDSHAALFAHGAWAAGQVKATYGTGSSVMGVTDRTTDLAGGLCLTVAWQDGDTPTFAVEGNIRASGATLGWLARAVDSTPARLAALAETADGGGVHLVPAFNGLGAPWWDNEAVGTISGLTLGTGLPQLARAALESIALQVEDVVHAVDDTVAPVPELLADGGASANPFLMQLQADISGRTVRRALDADLSPLGAAHLAGRAVGLWDTTALAALPRAHQDFVPRSTAEERERGRSAWRAALARSRGQSVR
ncbi:glycerol kinase [Nakamurella flavida]|uniref:ATP:glycerol 3-phosphotransferase n=1 Tax=Nakamurella flavida TaxID=363630 RepID=A0A938YIE5_9ACTN|nr:FGGY family carbohydrate kinase [Nakamurella flavida]MBM9478266.1 glycerol kinase [Nakamurella flavida]MDP9777563.1 glycerol kinase [Nakamurella flavida]